MSRITLILGILAFALMFGSSVVASADEGAGGNSFAWFRDNDGDGIPNGMDDDWVRPADGTGYMLKHSIGSFFGMFGGSEGGYLYQNQSRQRRNQPATPGDCVKSRLRLQDGSCK